MLVLTYAQKRAFFNTIKPIFMNKSLLARSIVMGFIVGIALYAIAAPQTINADENNISNSIQATLVHNGNLTVCMLNRSSFVVVKTMKVMATAYSPTPDQTDDSPLITASGKHVKEGMIALNGVKFGTMVRIPELYGDKIFVVEDRMHQRKGTKHIDILMATREEANEFGAKIVDIQFVQS